MRWSTADHAWTARRSPQPTRLSSSRCSRLEPHRSTPAARLAGYFHIPSIAHYLIVHPSKRLVTHHRRTGKTIETTIVASGELRLDPPGITITLADIYDDPS